LATRLGLVLGLGVLALCTTPTHAQLLDQAWADRHQAAIDEHRKADVKFIVLDAKGQPVEGVGLRVKQINHRFEVGIELHDLGTEARSPSELKAFNAISLERFSNWYELGQAKETTVDAFTTHITQAAWRGDAVHFGAFASADYAKTPDRLIPLSNERVVEAARGYLQKILSGIKLVPHIRYDLCDDTLDHDRFTPAMLRILRLEIDAMDPDAEVFLPFDGGLQGPRVLDVLKAVDDAEKDFLNLDGYTIRQRFTGKLDQAQLSRNLTKLARLAPALVISGVEVGGPTAIDRTLNMETLLYTLFAEPKVKGIYFAGFTADQLAMPEAALIDEDGELTGAGKSLDRLFSETWWTDLTLTTDELGNASGRVYLGMHEITVTFPDGRTLEVPLRIDEQEDEPRLVVLQAIE
jgi:hypothetical protein